MSKAYVVETRHHANGAWTRWLAVSYSPNLDYAREDLGVMLRHHAGRDDRAEMKGEWNRVAREAAKAEIGGVLECDERQWRISLD